MSNHPVDHDSAVGDIFDTATLMDFSAELGSASASPDDADSSSTSRPRRTTLACIRCRTRHIRCPGGNPCKKCILARTKCEYVTVDKKVAVSMKYLSKLHDDIARLKRENAGFRTKVKETEFETVKLSQALQKFTNQGLVLLLASSPRSFTPQTSFHHQYTSPLMNGSLHPNQQEVIQPSLDKHGRLVQSQTGEKVYVGLSSMTLFGLEIQNMVPGASSLDRTMNSTNSALLAESMEPSNSLKQAPLKREAEILEKEGNMYLITLTKTNTRPGCAMDLHMPSYSYAMLLVDTFINYNDGCFYFFNEGLVKQYLTNMYSGRTKENQKILMRNLNTGSESSPRDESHIKIDTDDENILESIWFCKILLIFATGEMYLGIESDTHIQNSKNRTYSKQPQKLRASSSSSSKTRKTPRPSNKLPGADFFFQASELFTGIFAAGAVDNSTKDGGIETLLLYAFYLQVADCTVSSYFYFGLALRSALSLGWHVDAESSLLNRHELEHRRRLWWTVYMYERMLSSKAGLPLSFADDSVSTEMPTDFNVAAEEYPCDERDVRQYYIFPSAEYINNCVIITQINAIILSSLYTKQPTMNILPVVLDLVQRLMAWKTALPDFLKIDFNESDLKVSRLIVNLMTEYFQGMNLAVRPLLFHFATKKLTELHRDSDAAGYLDLTKFSKNVLALLNASFQASINTVKCIWALMPSNMVALFGWMDREYLFTSASTLILFNASFGVHDATKEHLDHALSIFTKMKRLGNHPAALRRAQLLKLIKVLDFNGLMQDLVSKHDEDDELSSSPKEVPRDAAQSLVRNSLAQMESDLLPFIFAPHSRKLEIDLSHFTSGPSINLASLSQPHSQNLPFQLFPVREMPSTDIYGNSDLAGIEGLTFMNDEQQLWTEITNDAVWLNVADGTHDQQAHSHESILNDLGTGLSTAGTPGTMRDLHLNTQDQSHGNVQSHMPHQFHEVSGFKGPQTTGFDHRPKETLNHDLPDDLSGARLNDDYDGLTVPNVQFMQ